MSDIAERIRSQFNVLKKFGLKTIPTGDLKLQIDKLQKEVDILKTEGISIWNASRQMPKIFDIIDGAFVVMREVVNKLGDDNETK